MRSPGSALVRTLCGLALALIATAGCSKKVTEPNSRPLPEGEQDGSMLMVGWLEQGSVSFTVADPGTPNEPLDDVLHEVFVDYWRGPGNLRTATLDASAASQLEAFRIAPDGNVEDMFDFFLPASLKFIGQGLDVYEFEESEPPSPARYVGRGVDERVPTTASAVSNRIEVSGTIDESLLWLPLPKQFANDSVFKIQYTEDPRAEFYIIAVNGGSDLLGTGLNGATNRRGRAIPHPLEPFAIPLSGIFFVVPPGVGQAGIFITLSSGAWPLTFYIRVSAYDANGRMVNRVNHFLRTQGRDGELNLTFFEPMGGAVQMLDPYPPAIDPVPPPDMLSNAQAMAILAGYLGGGPAPTVTNFASSGSLLQSSGPPTIARQRALARIANAPMIRPEAVRRAIANVRAGLDRRERGEPAASAVRTARPGRGTATR